MKLPVNYNKLTRKARKGVRIEYIKLQDNKCYWCKESLDTNPTKEVQEATIDLTLFPPHFLDHPIHLQHCHNTHMTEGAVHARCNAVMWQYHGR